jgi:penicillin-binding protein 1A
VKTIRDMGIGEHEPYLSTALGAGSTTVSKLTNAYSMLVNHGRELKPRLIDYVQDRRGRVIFPLKWKPCEGCNRKDWDGRPMPRFAPDGKQLMDPLTAYQTVHMLEGVIQRGTAVTLRDLKTPMFGKTGTTTGPKDVWFVGGTREVVAGVYIGFDKPRDMGAYAQGGSLAAPIFKQFAREALSDRVPLPFIAPRGIRMVRVDRKTGRRVYGAWPGDDPKSAVIWEAFKAESEPRRSIRNEEIEDRKPAAKKKAASGAAKAKSKAEPRRDSEFLEERGGII